MKRALILITSIVCLGYQTYAQDFFEGKIHYDIQMEGENADMMKSFMPSGFDYWIKESGLKFSVKGGMMESMMGEWIIDNESGIAYMLQHSSQTAYKIDPAEYEEDDSSKMKPEITKLNEKQQIAGYECQKYQVKMESEMGTIEQEIWATDQINVKKPKVQTNSNVNQLFVEGLDAFPLKVISEMPMGIGKMIMTASQIQPASVDDSLLELPADYKIEIFDPEKFGQEMMGNY